MVVQPPPEFGYIGVCYMSRVPLGIYFQSVDLFLEPGRLALNSPLELKDFT